MCGFAGEFVFTEGQANVQLVCAMAEKLRHRGPDEKGSFTSADGRCAIGFRRLAVIDPAGSHQPMTSADSRITVAFNGEIYNFRTLRTELDEQGASFRTSGDTEILLSLYDRYGEDMLRRLSGMFAFVLYDSSAGRLLLARDRLGQKPLWYSILNDRIVFASEAKALLVHPNIDKQTDSQALTLYATMGYVPAPRSAWKGVNKLPPAHSMIVAGTPAEPQRYWKPQPLDLSACSSDLPELVKDRLYRTVEQHMISDVPLGALLSGGIDSSIIVAIMARVAGRAGGVRTFTAGFDEADFDERPDATLVAEHCGTDHTEILVRPSPAEMLDQLLAIYDEPFGDSSALPTWLICREARKHVTVALVGDGGDEVFAGYDRYRALHLAETMSRPMYLAIRLAAAAGRLAAPHDARSRLRRFVRFTDALSYPPSIQYFMYRRLFGPDELPRLFTEEFIAGVDADAPAEWFCRLYEDGDFPDEVARAQHHDMLTYLPDDLLVKTDMASMASSLELRSPMLDHNLLALGLSLPTGAKISGRRGKVILREAFADMLPAEVFARPKRGFAVPLGQWLKGELLEPLKETLLDPSFKRMGIFRSEAIAGLINNHVSGRADHRHRLWALLILARWLAKQH